MEIKNVLVVGMGQMGAGIVQVCTQAGYKVYAADTNVEVQKKGLASVDARIESGVKKGRYTPEQKKQMMDNITVISSIEEAKDKDIDLVIEAIFERMDLKQQVHAELDRILPAKTILGTCTSALPVSEMASATKRWHKFIGIHFHQPVPVMKLVEIIRGIATDEDTYQTVFDFSHKLQKTPVTVKDVPGFITNRVGMPMTVEAIRAFAEGIATAEDIDTAFRDGMGYAFGPLQLTDFVGLDTTLYIMEDLYAAYGDSKFYPPPLIKKMVTLGHLGRKTGKGFYDYSNAEK